MKVHTEFSNEMYNKYHLCCFNKLSLDYMYIYYLKILYFTERNTTGSIYINAHCHYINAHRQTS